MAYKLSAFDHEYIVITCSTESSFPNVAIVAYAIQAYIREPIIIIKNMEYGTPVYVSLTQRSVFVARSDKFIWHGMRPYQMCQSLHRYQSLEYCIDRLVQERRNCIANALGVRLSCTNPSVWGTISFQLFGAESCIHAPVNSATIGLENGLLLFGAKQLSKPMFISIDTSWYHKTETIQWNMWNHTNEHKHLWYQKALLWSKYLYNVI